MQRAIDENLYHRQKQQAYNTEHGITPKAIKKKIENILPNSEKYRESITRKKTEVEKKIKLKDLEKENTDTKTLIRILERKMKDCVKSLDFMQAAVYRDEIEQLKKKME